MKNANDLCSPPYFLIQPLDHIGGGDLAAVKLGEGVEG